MVGDEDVIYTTPGVKEYVHGPSFKKDVPLLEDIVILEGVAHFLHQEKPELVNTYIHNFIKKFWSTWLAIYITKPPTLLSMRELCLIIASHVLGKF